MKNYTRLIMITALLQICSINHIFGQASLSITPDSTFGTNGTVVIPGPSGDFEYMNDMAIQPDGKIVIAGYIGNNGSVPSIARYFSNGALDTTFGSGGYTYLHSYWDRATSAISVIKLLANGKMIVSARHDSVSLKSYVARLNANGTLDSTFGTFGYTNFGAAYANPQMLVLSDGKIIYGYKSNNSSPAIYKLIKTDSSGVVDPLFGGAGFVNVSELSSVTSLILCQNDEILAAGNITGGVGFVRFLPNGNRDNTYGQSGLATYPYVQGSPIPVLQPDNSIVAGLAGAPMHVIHILSNGSTDMSYGASGLGTTASFTVNNNYPSNGAVTFNQETLITGYYEFLYNASYINFSELLAQTSIGTVDSISVSSVVYLTPMSIKILNGNKLLVGGNVAGWPKVSLTKYNIAPSPLVIQSFSAQKQADSTTLLHWSTATEQNYNHFEIRRSADGISNWETIGMVAAIGNSNVQANYSFIDSFPANGNNYYRVKLVGNNGKYTYSSATLLVNFAFAAASCAAPVPYVYEITGTTAKLKFNSGGGSALYYQYAIAPYPNNWTYPEPTEPPFGTPKFTVPDTIVTVTGLSATTRYFLWMRAKCSNNVATAWAASTFTTLCNTTTIPYTENFSNTTFPCIQNGKWYQDQNGNYGISLFSNYGGQVSSWFFTKRFQLNAGATYRIYFKYMSPNSTQSTSIKLQMSAFPDSNSLVSPVLLNMPVTNSYNLDTFALFTPTISGLYCAGFYSTSSYATGKVSIPEVDVLVDPGVPACTQNLAPLNNAVLSNCNNFLFKWNKVSGAQKYNIYLSDSIIGVNRSLLTYFPVTDTFYNYNLCAYPGDRFSWYVVPRYYGSNAIGCPADSSVFRMESPPPPPNDLCANAQTLIVTKGFCSSPVKGALLNATFSNPSDTIGICRQPFFGPPGMQPPPYTGHDVWYKVVVPVTGNLLVQISPFSSNAYVNTVMRAFSGTCGALTPIACSYVGLEGLPYNPYPTYSDRLKLTGRTPGETIFIRVSASSPSDESYFTICSYDTTTSQLPDMVTTPNVCTPILPVVIDSLSGNQFMWVPLLTADGKIIGEIYGIGNTFGTLNGAVYVNNGPVRSNAGVNYLDRNMTLTPSSFSLPDSFNKPSIRLYIKNNEIAAYNAAVGTSPLLNFKVVENNDPCSSAFTNPGKALGNIADSGVYKSDSWLSFLTSGFSSFYLYKGVTSLPLPITLLSFTDTKNNNDVQLNWQITNAINFSYFDVERSMDGSKFQKIVRINFNGGNFYQYIDKNPGPGTYYYRLKMTDVDGRSIYSQVVVVNFDYINFTIQPNPVISSFTINGPKGIRQLQLFDMNGRMVKEQKPSTGNVYNIAELPSGIYLLRIVTAESINNFKLIKQ